MVTWSPHGNAVPQLLFRRNCPGDPNEKNESSWVARERHNMEHLSVSGALIPLADLDSNYAYAVVQGRSGEFWSIKEFKES